MIRYTKNHIFKIIGLLIIAFSFILLGVNKIIDNNKKSEEIVKVNSFLNDDTYNLINTNNINTNKKIEEDNFIAVLEIPKISLKKGLSLDKNNINYNIEIVSGSTFFDENNSNLVLAAHSGNSKISFFKNLYKLAQGDIVYIYYDGIKYEFVIYDIYDVLKDGTVEIERYQNKKTITLITCKKNSNNYQTVYVGYLTESNYY